MNLKGHFMSFLDSFKCFLFFQEIFQSDCPGCPLCTNVTVFENGRLLCFIVLWKQSSHVVMFVSKPSLCVLKCVAQRDVFFLCVYVEIVLHHVTMHLVTFVFVVKPSVQWLGRFTADLCEQLLRNLSNKPSVCGNLSKLRVMKWSSYLISWSEENWLVAVLLTCIEKKNSWS